MAYSHIFLACIVVVAFLSTASADNGVDDVGVNPLVTNENSADADVKVEGSIFCVKKGKWIAMEGARAVVICKLFSLKSTKTDVNGYFLVKLPSKRLNDDCKVFLLHGKGRCTVPTNINNGISGASLAKSDYPNLYTVKSFVYNPLPL